MGALKKIEFQTVIRMDFEPIGRAYIWLSFVSSGMSLF